MKLNSSLPESPIKLSLCAEGLEDRVESIRFNLELLDAELLHLVKAIEQLSNVNHESHAFDGIMFARSYQTLPVSSGEHVLIGALFNGLLDLNDAGVEQVCAPS